MNIDKLSSYSKSDKHPLYLYVALRQNVNQKSFSCEVNRYRRSSKFRPSTVNIFNSSIGKRLCTYDRPTVHPLGGLGRNVCVLVGGDIQNFRIALYLAQELREYLTNHYFYIGDLCLKECGCSYLNNICSLPQ